MYFIIVIFSVSLFRLKKGGSVYILVNSLFSQSHAAYGFLICVRIKRTINLFV